MDILDVLSMIGGLALFLYGMNLMGDGLTKLSGGKLERILERLTSNPIKGVFLGLFVTAVIQSSSATTVMVVGFVNSGIMRLSQAVYIIMGANVGTTVTSWILALTGIKGDSLFMQLLKPTSFSPVLALIGIILILFTKKQKKRDIGSILVGFSILMIGMSNMSDAVSGLSQVPEFARVMTMFENPVLGMLVGAALTAIIQSSSASVGILQAIASTGGLSYGAAFPIIMGQNIGTCVTAMISSVGASKNAKRAALVHLYFNIIGTVVFMAVFYTLNVFVDFKFMDSSADYAGIAVIHSVFNIVATLLLLPFGRVLEKLACMTIRDKEEKVIIKGEENGIQVLDSRFLDRPSFAIEQCKNASFKMAELSREALFKAMGLVKKYDESIAEEVVALENKVDRYEDELGTYLVKLSSKSMSEDDSRTLSLMLHAIGDYERISDHAINIQEAAKELYDKNQEFSKKAKLELDVMTRAIEDIMNMSLEVFEKDDVELAKKVEPMEEVIDFLSDELKARHIQRLREGKCTIELGFIFSDLSTSYERISDHCSNIAVSVIEISSDGYDKHEYLEAVKHEDPVFKQEYAEYKKRYELPEAH